MENTLEKYWSLKVLVDGWNLEKLGAKRVKESRKKEA
jgi:hypothetical protein